MGKKIVFGSDLAKELKKYGLNKIGEVPTKYKNGITTIYYMWSVVSNIDKLGYKTPYIEYTTDEETDGFITGTMFPQGGDGLGTQFDTFEDVKYFINNAEYSNADLTESKKSIKEGKEEDRLEKVYIDLLDGKDSEFINGTLSLKNFETSDFFFIPYSSWKTFPKKNPSNSNRTWNCKAKYLNDDAEWQDCTIVCTLPWEENLDAMGKTWNDITSAMLLVDSIFLDF